ncbi:MAG: hypothetical protein ACJ75P_09935 [Gaiellaceae bacterium]
MGTGPNRRCVWAAGLALAAWVAASSPAGAAPEPLLLPPPTQPLDAKVPLRTDATRSQLQLPLSARLDSRERVLVRTLPDGRVVAVRVVQRLSLTGTGDYFLSVPAPLLDVRAGPGSEAEPGFRRSGILWQGFANRGRALVADAKLDPGPAGNALPLRVELAATVGGRELGTDERRSGRLRLELTLRNTTAVRVASASARPARPPELEKLVADLRSGRIPEQAEVDVEGPVRRRRVVVDAPLAVSGEVRLPVRRLDAAVIHGGSLVRRGRAVVVRFRLVLTHPKTPSASIELSGSAVGAGAPEASLTAEPTAGPALAAARPTIDSASRLLLTVARVRQYDAFLANPAPGGSVEAVYRYETTDAPRITAAAPASNEGGVILPVLAAIAVVAGAGGLVVLWAHL